MFAKLMQNNKTHWKIQYNRCEHYDNNYTSIHFEQRSTTDQSMVFHSSDVWWSERLHTAKEAFIVVVHCSVLDSHQMKWSKSYV